jgi:hypothetical protein
MQARKIVLFSGGMILPLFLYGTEPNFTIQFGSDINNSKNIGYVFAHGLGATQEQASLFLSNKWIINKPAVLFDFPDAKNNNMEYYPEYVNLGQELDIQRFELVVSKAIKELPNYKFVLSGISRGAATILNYVALYQPDHAAALVLESPFDTFNTIVKHLLKRFHVSWIPFSKSIALRIAQKNFPLLNIEGIFPLTVVHKVPGTIPILIIHSRNDRTIPINSSRNLYKTLVESGNKDTYILELASGEHGKLAYGPESDLYVNVVHAFYKKYNLPHNPNFAHVGETMLSYCQPSIDEITKRMRRKRMIDDFVLDEDDTDYATFYDTIIDDNARFNDLLKNCIDLRFLMKL